MKFGFAEEPAQAPVQPSTGIKLPKPVAERRPDAANVALAVQAGKDLGFVSREAVARRKPGPKRKEPQSKITIAGPKRILDRLQAYCDKTGVSYHEALEALLDRFEGR